jgi:hypothetical protein
MPLATGLWCFRPASCSSRIAELASCDLEFDYANLVVKASMKPISNIITQVYCCSHISFYLIQKPRTISNIITLVFVVLACYVVLKQKIGQSFHHSG